MTWHSARSCSCNHERRWKINLSMEMILCKTCWNEGCNDDNRFVAINFNFEKETE